MGALFRFLITLGFLLVVAGLIWPLLEKIGIGRLPGDIVVEHKGFDSIFRSLPRS